MTTETTVEMKNTVPASFSKVLEMLAADLSDQLKEDESIILPLVKMKFGDLVFDLSGDDGVSVQKETTWYDKVRSDPKEGQKRSNRSLKRRTAQKPTTHIPLVEILRYNSYWSIIYEGRLLCVVQSRQQAESLQTLIQDLLDCKATCELQHQE